MTAGKTKEGDKDSELQLVKLSWLLAWNETDLDVLYYPGLVVLQYTGSQGAPGEHPLFLRDGCSVNGCSEPGSAPGAGDTAEQDTSGACPLGLTAWIQSSITITK